MDSNSCLKRNRGWLWHWREREREGGRERAVTGMEETDRRMKEATKASGLPDLKARRKAHMAPTTGQPISPGGSRARLAAPSAASLYHPWSLRAPASRRKKRSNAPTAATTAAHHIAGGLATASPTPTAISGTIPVRPRARKQRKLWERTPSRRKRLENSQGWRRGRSETVAGSACRSLSINP